MSVYNSDKTIQNAIESILNQTYSNIEILIMNDGSSDFTARILEKYEQQYPKITIYNNEKNIGLTKSLNILLSKARGELIARQDADDESMPARIEKQVSKLLDKRFDFCTTRALRMDTKGIIPNLSYFLPAKFVMKFKNPFIHGTLMIWKSAITKIGYYDEKFLFAQDYKLFNDLIDQDYKFINMSDILYSLNMKENISINNKKEQKYFASCVRKKIIPQ